MKFKAALFDLDGTLVHTPTGYINSVINHTLRDLGIQEVNEKTALEFWFAQDMDDFASMWTKDLDTFWHFYRSHDTPEKRSTIVKLYPDVRVLKKLQRAGIILGILTSAPKPVATYELKLLSCFDFTSLVFAQPIYGVKRKPDAQGVKQFLELAGVSKEETVYIGNGIEDILAGKNAGVFDVFLERDEYPYALPLNSRKHIKKLDELSMLFNL